MELTSGFGVVLEAFRSAFTALSFSIFVDLMTGWNPIASASVHYRSDLVERFDRQEALLRLPSFLQPVCLGTRRGVLDRRQTVDSYVRTAGNHRTGGG